MSAQLLDCTPDEYHLRDGLSASIATTLVTRSPLHAWSQHPRFGAKGKAPTKAMDRGSVVHQLVLGKGKQFCELSFDDYRTKAAQAARDGAREAGLVPILSDELAAAHKTAAQVQAQLEAHGLHLDGTSEAAVEWHEASARGPVVCRGMMDHLWLDAGVVLDLKIVTSAAPPTVERSAETFGYAIQRAAYTSAVAKLRPELAGRVDFLFAFCEAEAPFAMNLCRGDGTFRELGERRWQRAVEAWAVCLESNTWPGYGAGINQLSAPQWALAREDF